MKPSQVAATLRRIAAKIEASKNPDRSLVARDLKRVVVEVVAAPVVAPIQISDLKSMPIQPGKEGDLRFTVTGTSDNGPFTAQMKFIDMGGDRGMTWELENGNISPDLVDDLASAMMEHPEYEKVLKQIRPDWF